MEKYTFESEYIPGKTDPYQRILNLKAELIDTKQMVDDWVKKFKDNEFIKETYNIGKLMDELELYKAKVDAFINYDIFNNMHNPDFIESDNESIPSANNSASDFKSANKFKSNFEKYNRIVENLLGLIKSSENDVINNKGEYSFSYEIFANPENEIDNLTGRINEIEDLINNLERTIGNWAIVLILIILSLYFFFYLNFCEI